MDHLTVEERSRNMSKIRSKNTLPEKTVRSLLHKNGYRFRLHRKDLPGTPDIFLPKYNTAVFVHGCFWHQHEGCKNATTPKTNKAFWISKFKKNIAHFKKSKKELKKMNLKIVVIWECEINNPKKILKRFEPKS
jgi:DNA mismatch endonuclease, patch repair protein